MAPCPMAFLTSNVYSEVPLRCCLYPHLYFLKSHSLLIPSLQISVPDTLDEIALAWAPLRAGLCWHGPQFPPIWYAWSRFLLKPISPFAGYCLLLPHSPPSSASSAAFPLLAFQSHIARSSSLAALIPRMISGTSGFADHPNADDGRLSSVTRDFFHEFQASISHHLLPSSSPQAHRTGSFYLIRLKHLTQPPAPLRVDRLDLYLLPLF